MTKGERRAVIRAMIMKAARLEEPTDAEVVRLVEAATEEVFALVDALQRLAGLPDA